MDAVVFTLVALCVVFATAGAVIGERNGAGSDGFFLGLFLGPIGLVLAFIAVGDRLPCPACRELTHRGATICPRCRTPLTAVSLVTAGAHGADGPVASPNAVQPGTYSPHALSSPLARRIVLLILSGIVLLFAAAYWINS